MAKRKPGRPRKAVTSVAKYVTLATQWRPPKSGVSEPAKVFEHEVAIHDSYGTHTLNVQADNVAVVNGVLTFTKEGRTVGAFLSWSYFTEFKEVVKSPPIPEVILTPAGDSSSPSYATGTYVTFGNGNASAEVTSV